MDQELLERASHYLKKKLASTLKMEVQEIGTDTPLEKYGIDSVMVLELTDILEPIFGFLPKTLFFEYQNIKALAEYFIEFHQSKLLEILDMVPQKQQPIQVVAQPKLGEQTVTSFPRNRFAQIAAPTRLKRESGPLDIAVIGLSGRYPQARNLNEFWENLKHGRDCISEIPKERWDYNLYYDPDKNKKGAIYSKWGGFIDDVDKFDPLFFNISPREAEIVDPQEKLFLEIAWETIEDAGYTRAQLYNCNESGLEGNVGVFVGVMYAEYQLFGVEESLKGQTVALAGNPASIANRVSYFFNFHGPSMAVETMCSSSLTTIHLACQSIKKGNCELALAGGVNISIHPNKYILLANGKFISSTGRCESFGKGGDGYVPGEGVGCALLKPLEKAKADGDHIYGIIKGTAINHGARPTATPSPILRPRTGSSAERLRPPASIPGLSAILKPTAPGPR